MRDVSGSVGACRSAGISASLSRSAALGRGESVSSLLNLWRDMVRHVGLGRACRTSSVMPCSCASCVIARPTEAGSTK